MDLSSFVRRDISGIRKDILPLSGFGILSHALADEIAARNQAREGYFYTTDMEFLEEGEPEQQPMLPPVPRKPETVRMDMNILFKIVQESGENGKALPAGTRKMLERVRTILKANPQGRPMSAPQTVQQRNIPLTQSTRSAPAMPLTQSVPSVSSAQAVRAAQPGSPMMPMPRQRSTAQPLPQNRMQNPLRDPKAPLTVERLHTPTHEVPRASDHAMLFSDVLHRAQDSGLTFAPRQGQGGVPASAQTRAAYTTQALRQARAEQQAAEARSAPAWQRTALKEASQTPSGAAGASWRFDETARNGDAVGAMAAMAAPRYPEAELNFVQEAALQEGAEMPIPTVQHPNAETLRAVQEASAKALTETVRSALKEAAPLMTAPAVTTAARNAQSARTESPAQISGRPGQQMEPQQGGQMAAPVSQSGTVPQARQTDQSTGTPQADRSIPPRSNSMVENRAESIKSAENAGKAAEMPAGTVAEHAAGTTETPARNRIPALTGDRAFAQTPEEAADILRRMAAPRYPEAELNFVQEAAPQEGAEMPISTAQHPDAETLRAVQEASAKALTETVRAALKEAAPLMTAPAAAAAARNAQPAQNAQDVRSKQAVRNTPAAQNTQAMQTMPTGNAGRNVAHPGQGKAALQEMQKQAEQAARETAAQTLSETAARQTMQTAQTRTAQATAQPGEKERFRAGHPAFRQETAEAAREFAGTMENRASTPQTIGVLPGEPGAAYPLDEVEARLPPLGGGQTIPGQLTGQNVGQMPGQLPGQAGGMERAVELLRQNGYGAPQLEYRMEDAGPEAPQMPQTPELSRQAGAAAEKSLLWLGEKVAANAARELSRMRRTMPEQSARAGSVSSAGSAVQRNQKAPPGGISPVGQMNLKSQPGSASTSGQMSQKGPSGSVSTAGQWNRQGRPGQPGNAGSTGSAGNLADMQSAGNRSQPGGAFQTVSHPASQRADWMGYRPIEMAHPAAHTPGWTAARPMGIPAEAQWRPGGQSAPAVISPAEMPHLMYQTGQTEDGEIPFAPAGSGAKPALPQLGTSLEVQSAYPALSMEYSSPMSRMEQQLQSAVAQQMSAASRPMGMQTEAGQYMAGKAAPGGMTTLDQMSAPPVNDQIVWQNPYLRSAPADMTYRNKKKPPEQPQPAPRPQTVRMSDAEIHRMADQVFRIVKDKIRQERRKMGL